MLALREACGGSMGGKIQHGIFRLQIRIHEGFSLAEKNQSGNPEDGRFRYEHTKAPAAVRW